MPIAKKKRSHKGKRHPAHAASFLNVAKALDDVCRELMPEARQAVRTVGLIMRQEGERLQKIVR